MSNEKVELVAGTPYTMPVTESDFHIIEPTKYSFYKHQLSQLRRHAIVAAEELLRRPDEFEISEAQRRAAQRIRMNSTRDRWKLLKVRDMANIARLGRLKNLVPLEN